MIILSMKKTHNRMKIMMKKPICFLSKRNPKRKRQSTFSSSAFPPLFLSLPHFFILFFFFSCLISLLVFLIASRFEYRFLKQQFLGQPVPSQPFPGQPNPTLEVQGVQILQRTDRFGQRGRPRSENRNAAGGSSQIRGGGGATGKRTRAVRGERTTAV